MFFQDRRIGKFKMNIKFVEENPELVAEVVLKGCVPLRVECEAYMSHIEYTVWCEDFERISVGQVIPEYEAEITDVAQINGGVVHSRIWRKTA